MASDDLSINDQFFLRYPNDLSIENSGLMARSTRDSGLMQKGRHKGAAQVLPAIDIEG